MFSKYRLNDPRTHRYPGLCKRAVDVLCCRQLAPGDLAESGTGLARPGIWVLRSDYSVQCYDRVHTLHSAVAAVFVVIAVLIPMAVVWKFRAAHSAQPGT